MNSKSLLTTGIIIFCFFISFSQDKNEWGVPIDPETNKVMYTGVIETPGMKKDQLFDKSFSWLKNYFVAVDKKIYVKDKAAGKIQLNAHMQLYTMEKKLEVKDVLVKYKIDLFFKDGKYKYTLYKFIVPKGNQAFPVEKWMNSNYSTPENAKRRFSQLDVKVEKVIKDFKTAMKTTAAVKDDDW